MKTRRALAEAGADRRFHLNPTIVAAVIGLIGSVVVAVIQVVGQLHQKSPATSPEKAGGGATRSDDARSSEEPGINCLEGPVGGATPNGGAPPSEGSQITGLQITCPKRGDGVLNRLTVRGTASMQDEGHFWVIVQKVGGKEFKPQKREGFAWVPETEGTWEWLTYIGSKTNPQTDHQYDVIVVKLPDGVCQELEDYLKAKEDYDKAADKGQKPPEPLRGLDHLPCKAARAEIAHSVRVFYRPG